MSRVQQVLVIIAEILEIDVAEITLETELHDDIWDSLAVVTFISEVDSNFDQIISPTDVGAAKIVADLVALVK